MSLDHERLRELTDRLAITTSKLGPLEATRDSLKAQIRELLSTEGPGEYQAGDRVVSASANRGLDLVSLAAKYPPTTHPQLYKLTPDTKAVRRELPADEVESFMAIRGDLKIGVS
jgi:hypothetical protein